jgi:serine/threonine protein kinase
MDGTEKTTSSSYLDKAKETFAGSPKGGNRGNSINNITLNELIHSISSSTSSEMPRIKDHIPVLGRGGHGEVVRVYTQNVWEPTFMAFSPLSPISSPSSSTLRSSHSGTHSESSASQFGYDLPRWRIHEHPNGRVIESSLSYALKLIGTPLIHMEKWATVRQQLITKSVSAPKLFTVYLRNDDVSAGNWKLEYMDEAVTCMALLQFSARSPSDFLCWPIDIHPVHRAILFPYCSQSLEQYIHSYVCESSELLRMVRHITSAIAFLQAHDWIHFDVKTDNIFRSMNRGRWCLGDWGTLSTVQNTIQMVNNIWLANVTAYNSQYIIMLQQRHEMEQKLNFNHLSSNLPHRTTHHSSKQKKPPTQQGFTNTSSQNENVLHSPNLSTASMGTTSLDTNVSTFLLAKKSGKAMRSRRRRRVSPYHHPASTLSKPYARCFTARHSETCNTEEEEHCNTNTGRNDYIDPEEEFLQRKQHLDEAMHLRMIKCHTHIPSMLTTETAIPPEFQRDCPFTPDLHLDANTYFKYDLYGLGCAVARALYFLTRGKNVDPYCAPRKTTLSHSKTLSTFARLLRAKDPYQRASCDTILSYWENRSM